MSMNSRRLLRGIGIVCALALGATACGGSDGGDTADRKQVSAADIQAALKKGGTITVWAWEPTLKKVAADFEKEHPGVHVDVVNSGTNNDAYTALQNAISAKKGVPDVAQIEYYALGQYTLTRSVTDLSAFGADKLADTYSPGPWNAVTSGKAVHALPMDSGPMALFYNKKVFDKHKIAVPTTWDEYLKAARDLHKADPKAYITSDTGDAGSTTSLLWQAGSRPYQVDGTKVKIDFSDKGAAAYTGTWQKLLDEKLLAHMGPELQQKVIRAPAPALEKGKTDARISAMDETTPGLFAQNWGTYPQEVRDLVGQMNVHTYGTGQRTTVRDLAKAADRPLWMSEVEGDWGDGQSFTDMRPGLGLAQRIVDDLRELEPRAWVFWQPVEDCDNMKPGGGSAKGCNWGSIQLPFSCTSKDTLTSCPIFTNTKFDTARNFT